MNRKLIYMSGGMSNVTDEVIQKREKLAEMMEALDNFRVFKPWEFYNYNIKLHESEREIMNYELYQLKHSDIVIVDLIDPKSIGTAMELAVAHEHGIPIIGYNPYNNKLHPWITEMCHRIFKTTVDLGHYVGRYYNI